VGGVKPKRVLLKVNVTILIVLNAVLVQFYVRSEDPLYRVSFRELRYAFYAIESIDEDERELSGHY